MGGDHLPLRIIYGTSSYMKVGCKIFILVAISQNFYFTLRLLMIQNAGYEITFIFKFCRVSFLHLVQICAKVTHTI